MGWREGRILDLRVKATPNRGQANSAVRKLLSVALGVRAEDVTIRSGARTRTKLIAVSGVSEEELEARVGKLTRNNQAAH
jgi:uncharacterized protein YggU (UPF0235/DUF167 family)